MEVLTPDSSQLLLYLGFDGVLHDADVQLTRFGASVAHGALFQHAAALELLLAPFPEVRIVLSTRWVGVFGVDRATQSLPPALWPRVVGATTGVALRKAEPNVPRGIEVWDDVQRRRAHPRWVAVDDDDEGWTKESRPHLVLSDAKLGLGNPQVAEALASALTRFCSTRPTCST